MQDKGLLEPIAGARWVQHIENQQKGYAMRFLPWQFGITILFALLTSCAIASQNSVASTTPTRGLPTAIVTPSKQVLQFTRSPTDTMPPTQLPTTSFLDTDVPLNKAAIATCPVSLPNISKSPAENYLFETTAYQNEDGTLITWLWSEGVVIFARDGPGSVLPDGSLAMKWPWWRGVRGKLTIEGRRLDAPASAPRGEIAEGYGDSGFQPTTLIFPTQGCWEITGKIGNARLTFVTLVVKVPFRFVHLNWVPKVILTWKYDTSNLPDSLREIAYSNGGELIIESAVDEQPIVTPDPGAAQQKVTVWGQPGICVQGELVNRQWKEYVDAGFLQWTAEGSSYRIVHKGLELRCDDLVNIVMAP